MTGFLLAVFALVVCCVAIGWVLRGRCYRPQRALSETDLKRLEKCIMKIEELGAALEPIVTNLTETATGLASTATTLADTGAQLEKATGEIVEALQSANVPDDVVAKVTALGEVAAALKSTGASLVTTATGLKTAAEGLDALNPDR